MTDTSLPQDMYCRDCKERKVVFDYVIVQTDSGREKATGLCPTCFKRVHRILRSPVIH